MKGMRKPGIADCLLWHFSAAFFGYLYGSIFMFEGHLVEEYLGFTLSQHGSVRLRIF
jgi:hypothetical protein